MNMIQVAISVVGVNAAFVGLLEVMTNVEEFSVIKEIAELPSISITGHQSSKPIVSDHDRRLYHLLTAVFKTCLVENCELEYDVPWASIRVRLGEHLSIMEEYNFNTSFHTLVNSNFHP